MGAGTRQGPDTFRDHYRVATVGSTLFAGSSSGFMRVEFLSAVEACELWIH